MQVIGRLRQQFRSIGRVVCILWLFFGPLSDSWSTSPARGAVRLALDATVTTTTVYIFTPSEGDAIPKDDGVAVADDMRNRVRDKMETDISLGVNSFYDSATCAHYSRCETIIVHAERRGHKIIVMLKFRYWAQSLGPHPEVTDEKPCLVEEGTTEKDCLEAELGVLSGDLISHVKQYHGGK